MESHNGFGPKILILGGEWKRSWLWGLSIYFESSEYLKMLQNSIYHLTLSCDSARRGLAQP